MITEALTWGLKPKFITGDSWYSSIENLKFLRNKKPVFLMVIAKNRQIALQPGCYTKVSNLVISPDGFNCISEKVWVG